RGDLVTGVQTCALPIYNYWAQYKDYWCKHGQQYGSYIQQIEYDNCRSGYVWTPGQAVNASIGQGYVTVTPLQLARAYAALANGRSEERRVGQDGRRWWA